MTTAHTATPKHKAAYSFSCRATCSCGWKGVDFCGKGAKTEAAKEYKWHISQCEVKS